MQGRGGRGGEARQAGSAGCVGRPAPARHAAANLTPHQQAQLAQAPAGTQQARRPCPALPPQLRSRDGGVPSKGQAQRGARSMVHSKVEQEAAHCRAGARVGRGVRGILAV